MKKTILLSFILLYTVNTVGCTDQAETVAIESEVTETPTAAEEVQPTIEPDTIFVFVSGAVNAPGVYEIARDARAYEAIAAAGGLREDAGYAYINQARQLSDGEQIHILTQEEAQKDGKLPAQEGTADAGETVQKININTADESALITLSGIGSARAKAIIAYRTEHGRFAAIEDIKNVSGIKDALFSQIKEFITVD